MRTQLICKYSLNSALSKSLLHKLLSLRFVKVNVLKNNRKFANLKVITIQNQLIENSVFVLKNHKKPPRKNKKEQICSQITLWLSFFIFFLVS
jgi:hypothetical protein